MEQDKKVGQAYQPTDWDQYEIESPEQSAPETTSIAGSLVQAGEDSGLLQQPEERPLVSSSLPELTQEEVDEWMVSEEGGDQSGKIDPHMDFSIPLPFTDYDIGLGVTATKRSGVTWYAGTYDDYNKAVNEAAGLGMDVTTPPSAFNSAMFALSEGLPDNIRGTVGSRIFKTNMKMVEGTWTRLIEDEETGEAKWAAVNSLGMTGQDVSDFLASELIPFFAGAAIQTGAELMDPEGTEQRKRAAQDRKATSARGGIAKAAKGRSIPGKLLHGTAKIAAGGAGIWFGRTANHLYLKQHYNLSDEEMPITTAFGFDDPKAREAYLGMASEVGFRAVIASTVFVAQSIGGKHVPDSIVRALQDLHETYLERLPALKRVQAEADLPDISVTIGQMTGSKFLLDVEAEIEESAARSLKDVTQSDPFNKVGSAEYLMVGARKYVEKKFGETPGAGPLIEDLPFTENAIASAFKDQQQALAEGMTDLNKAASAEVREQMNKVAPPGGTVQTQSTRVRGAVKQARERMTVEFNKKYTDLTTMYGGLSGPNTYVAEAKEGFLNQLDTILEPVAASRIKNLAATRAPQTAPETLLVDRMGNPMPLSTVEETKQFLERSANPGEILTYKEIDDTLKALRVLSREIKDSGAQANDPGTAALNKLIKAYKLQREEIAALAPDGGKQLALVDNQFRTASGVFDNIQVRKLMMTIKEDPAKAPEELIASLFPENKSGSASEANDLLSQIVPALDGDHVALTSLRQSFINRYMDRVTDEASHDLFVKHYDGAMVDLFGSTPPTFKEAGARWAQVKTDDTLLATKMKALASHPLMANNVSGSIASIAKEGSPDHRTQLANLLVDSPKLQKDYMREYVKDLINGNRDGFTGVLSYKDGDVSVNPKALLAITGHLKEGLDGSGDPVLAMIGGVRGNEKFHTDMMSTLKDFLAIAEMQSLKGSAADKTKRGVPATIFQVLMGPLRKETRAVNAGDLYIRTEAGRQIKEIMADPDKLATFLEKHRDPKAWEKALKHGAVSLAGREHDPFGYLTSGGTEKISIYEPTEEEREEILQEDKGLGLEVIPGEAPTEAPTEQPKPDLSGMPTNPMGKVPPFMKRVLNPSKFPVLKNEDGSVSTHMMEDAEVDGKFVAYPTIVQKASGELGKIEGDALVLAMDTGNYVEFDTQEEASKFAMGGYKDHWGKEDGSQPLSDLRVPPQAPVSPPKASSPKPKANPKGITKIPSVAPKVTAGATTGNALKAKSVLEGSSIINASKKRAAR
jgi:hypothetical protein